MNEFDFNRKLTGTTRGTNCSNLTDAVLINELVISADYLTEPSNVMS